MRERLVPWSYWPTNPSPCSQPASAASAISPPTQLVDRPSSRSDAMRACRRGAARRPATNFPVLPPPLAFHTRWSGVASSVYPALVWMRRTRLRPFAFVATTLVSPLASYTLAPTASRSTNSPIGTKPAGVLTNEWYGWHALACCGTPLTPMLNHTGLLKAARWVTRMYFSSALNASASPSSTKYPPSMPHRVMVSTTRSTTWRNDDSRSGVPSVPRKYFWATMLVAFTDHATGNSTSRCSNATVPSFQLLIRASRRSHTTSSYGSTPGDVNNRRRPMDTRSGASDM